MSLFFPSMAIDLSVEWLETLMDARPRSSPKQSVRAGLSPAISIYSNSTPRRRTISLKSARGSISHTACYEMGKVGRFRACLKNFKTWRVRLRKGPPLHEPVQKDPKINIQHPEKPKDSISNSHEA